MTKSTYFQMNQIFHLQKDCHVNPCIGGAQSSSDPKTVIPVWCKAKTSADWPHMELGHGHRELFITYKSYVAFYFFLSEN